MKLIKTGQKTPEAPILIWGNKYRMLEGSNGIDEGTIVVIASAEIDCDGDIKVFSDGDWDYVKPHQLQAINQETLEPIKPLETETGEKILTVEISVDELKVIRMCIGETSWDVREKLKTEIYTDIKGNAGYIGDYLYDEAEDILKQGDK